MSGSASALSQRGHAFAFSFASKGEGEGRLAGPQGVAVDEASGDVYVVDAGNQRIERFGAKGEFTAAWGWGVSDGKSEYEICTSGCRAGIAGEGHAQLDAPIAIAVDNSSNPEDPSRQDVYALSDTVAQNNVVEKFSAQGEPLGELHIKSGAAGRLGGVAVDSSGTVWVGSLTDSELVSLSDARENQQLPGSVSLAEVECAETPGLAVDPPDQAFYVTHELANVEEECPETAPSAKTPALAAKLAGNGEVRSEALDYQDTSAVAVDLQSGAGTPLGEAARGDAYVDNLTSVAVFAGDGSLVQRLGTSEQLRQGSGVAVNSKTGAVYVADAKADHVDVFQPETPGRPSVDRLSFTDLSATSTRLEAQIDPHGADTHYYFQYGTSDCRATPSACSDLPGEPGGDIGVGFGASPVSVTAPNLTPGATYFLRVVASNANGPGEASQTFSTFTTTPGSADLLADNRAWELVSPAEKHGALIYPIGGSAEDGAPASGLIEASREGAAITYAANAPLGEGAPGNRALEATQAISTRGETGWSTRDIVTPHSNAEGLQPAVAQEYRWFSPDLSVGLVQPFGPFRLIGNHLQEPPLVPGVEREERGIYARNDTTCQETPATCYEPLVTPAADTTGAQFGGELEFHGATADARHVIFSSDAALSSSAPSAPGLYEWNAGKPASEALQLISILPGNQKAVTETEPQLGDYIPGGVSGARNAISSDGSRVFWSAATEEQGLEVTRLYMRDTGTHQTIVLNAPQGVKEFSVAERAREEVHFRAASADGSKAFFTDTFPLTAESRLRPGEARPADLYVCEITNGANGPECKLTDLTVDPNSDLGEAADVAGTLLGVSEEGSYVYFVANGVLDEQARADGALPGDCARPSSVTALANAKCNLYLEHYNQEKKGWELPRFITALSQQDSPDWDTSGAQSLAALTARVSPNGRYLAFMSKEPLTGYENTDASEAARGARDEEVYLYDAQSGRLVCASCNPSGHQPQGVLDRESSGEGKGLVADRFGVWQESEKEEVGGERRVVDHWLAGSIPGWTPIEVGTALYQSRYLSNEGRLFFDSPDALVAHDTNGKEDVYEYEPQGLGSCQSSSGCVALISSGESDHESAFLDASENGDDAFFITNQPLQFPDVDTAYDVYDAKVCRPASSCPTNPGATPQLCESLETCRPALPAPQVFSPPSGSATQPPPASPQKPRLVLPAPGKKPETRARKLARALSSCHKRYEKAKKRRAACERQARRRYGTRTATSRHAIKAKRRVRKGRR